MDEFVAPYNQRRNVLTTISQSGGANAPLRDDTAGSIRSRIQAAVGTCVRGRRRTGLTRAFHLVYKANRTFVTGPRPQLCSCNLVPEPVVRTTVENRDDAESRRSRESVPGVPFHSSLPDFRGNSSSEEKPSSDTEPHLVPVVDSLLSADK
ncbi:hypothetical protein JOB18_038779 [Solea senegalensis]|uniref:Uncharacterized protein n=1 Tax=Solea senegalensis TaxID=28829 RepID=A0AAV6R6I1_SOLSE|nr:hypothetical protein JOB18_038779 [Solea senegalensis]